MQERAISSEKLALSIQSNPVVARRILKGLREKGFVTSVNGPGGGWSIACELDQITLFDIYQAVDAPELLAIGNRNDTTQCQVEHTVNACMTVAYEAAMHVLIQRLQEVTLHELYMSIKKHTTTR